MYILFGWGKKPSAEEMKYRVTHFDVNFSSSFGDTKLANCVPGEMRINIEIPATSEPGKDFFNYAMDQHSVALDKGCGKIAVYKEKGVGQSIQEISFENGWISDIDTSVSEHDDKFNLSFTIVAAKITISGVVFLHPGRSESFL